MRGFSEYIICSFLKQLLIFFFFTFKCYFVLINRGNQCTILLSTYRKTLIHCVSVSGVKVIGNLNISCDIEIPNSQVAQAASSADVLDAVVCVLAGADFLRRKCIPIPDNLRDIAPKEGWIWVREK